MHVVNVLLLAVGAMVVIAVGLLSVLQDLLLRTPYDSPAWQESDEALLTGAPGTPLQRCHATTRCSGRMIDAQPLR